MMQQKLLKLGLAALTVCALTAEIKPPKPGMNMFSPAQDIELGKQGAAEVEKTMPVLNNAQINGYLQNIGKRLAASKYSGDWPFSFKGISDKNINAFALPGGPMFVNTATILAADNEAQLAGVMAHEMSHVVLRHGTNQASK